MRHRGNARRAAYAAAGMLLCVAGVAGADSGSPEAPPYSGMLLYGIERESGDLVRYNVDMEVLVTVGTVTDAEDRVYRNVEAAGYAPGYTNIFAFWRDPEMHMSRLVYVNVDTAEAAVVGDVLGPELITGAAVVASEAECDLYALAVPQPVAYDLVDGLVVPDETFLYRVDVLGSAITSGGEYDMPVTVRVEAGGDSGEPFGPFDDAVSGNVNNGTTPLGHVFMAAYEAGTPLRVSVQSWRLKSGEDGDRAEEWSPSMVLDNSSSELVHVLRNGDDLDDLPGYMNRASIEGMIARYVDSETGVVSMADDQVIYLMELGATPPHPAADYDDAVVLVTLSRRLDALMGQYTPPAGQIIRVNHETGRFVTLMYLQHRYESLATVDGSVFYGTRDGGLYKLDPSSRTEMMVAPISDDRVIGLGQSGSVFFGFEQEGDRVIGAIAETGSGVGLDRFIGADDLGTVVVTPEPDYPTESYD